MSNLLVPVAEWPILAWSFVAYLVWLYLLPSSLSLGRFGLWLLPWVGYYGYHPMHEGMSMAEVTEICARLDGEAKQ